MPDPNANLMHFLSQVIPIAVGVVLILLGYAAVAVMRSIAASRRELAAIKSDAGDEVDELDAEPVPPTPSPSERRRAAEHRIDVVRDDYGTRLSDPSYVIENHAIDDTAYPETVAFVDAYAAAMSYDRDKLGIDTLEAVAGRLERAWRACWQNAERIGLDALGEQKSNGKKALGLVRLAADPATPDTLLPELRRRIDALLLVCQITLPATAQAAILPPEHRALPSHPTA